MHPLSKFAATVLVALWASPVLAAQIQVLFSVDITRRFNLATSAVDTSLPYPPPFVVKVVIDDTVAAVTAGTSTTIRFSDTRTTSPVKAYFSSGLDRFALVRSSGSTTVQDTFVSPANQGTWTTLQEAYATPTTAWSRWLQFTADPRLADPTHFGGAQLLALLQSHQGKAYAYREDGTFPGGGDQYTGTATVTDVRRVTKAGSDFNGDGLDDLVFQNTAGQLVLWQLDGRGGIAASRSLYSAALGPWRMVAHADFNGDGRTDILFQGSDGELVAWFMDGAGGILGSQAIYAGPLGEWKVVAAADMNKDGFADIVFQAGHGAIYVWYGNGSGGFPSGGYLYGGAVAPWRIVGVVDLDNDGNPDILFQHPLGHLYIWYTNGVGGVVGQVHLYDGALPGYQVVSTADLNNDGTADVLFQRDDGVLYVWYLSAGRGFMQTGVFYGAALYDWRAFAR